jgi:hypothetical protein
MMVGFFDVAVPAGVDKEKFFERAKTEKVMAEQMGGVKSSSASAHV